jgi:predicted methyltransferase
MKNLLILFAFVFYLPILNSHTLEKAISSDDRETKNILRDSYRNQYETLSFF